MGAMEELAVNGNVRFIGVSNFSAAELHQAQKAYPEIEGPEPSQGMLPR